MDLDDEFDLEIDEVSFGIIDGEIEDDGDVGNVNDEMISSQSQNNPETGDHQSVEEYLQEDDSNLNQTDEVANVVGESEALHISPPASKDHSSGYISDTGHDESSFSIDQKEESAHEVQENGFENDDEDDAIFSQINEKEMYMRCGGGSNFTTTESKPIGNITSNVSNNYCVPISNLNHRPKKSPAKRAYNNETLSFFLSQESDADNIPLKRTFPGPAGVLPELNSEQIKLLNYSPHPLCQRVSTIIQDPAFKKTQASKRKGTRNNNAPCDDRKIMISKAPRRRLLQALDLNLKDEHSLLHFLNIRWVRTMVSRLPDNVNVPFLVVVVRDDMEIVNSSKEKVGSKTPSCRLMDPSGNIVAAVDPTFVDAFAGKLMPGTAIALRKCGVSKFGKQIILTGCRRNVLYLVTGKKLDDEDDEHTTAEKEYSIHEYKIENDLLIMEMSKFNQQQILKEYESILKLKEMESLYEDPYSEIHLGDMHTNVEPQQKPPLFTTVSSNGSFGDVHKYANAVLYDSNVSNFNLDSSGFDDDDDDELLQALENVNFEIEEKNL